MLDDPKLMKSLLDLVLKIYGWKSSKVKSEIQQLMDDVRADERRRFARFFHQLLLDNQHLSVGELLDKVKSNESSCRENVVR